MTHLEFAASEAVALESTTWDLWIAETERLAKGHDIGRDEPGNLDGDQGKDGFSMDGAFDAFENAETPDEGGAVLPLFSTAYERMSGWT